MYPLMANPMGQRPLMSKADGDGGIGGNIDPGMGGGNVTRPTDPYPVQGGPSQGPPADNMPNPLPPGTPPFNPDPSQGGGPPGGGFTDWIKNQFGNFQGVLSNPSLIPSLAAAYQQYQQAHQYTDMAEGYARQLDPFGQQRSHYQDLMKQSYDDPTSVLQGPAYQKQLKFELGNLAIQDGGKGWGGSGNMMAALSDRQQNMDQQHLDDYRKGLEPLTGAQFGPQSAAAMLQTGLLGRMGAENNAIGNLMVPFSNQNSNNRSPGGGIGGQAGRTPSPQSVLNALKPGSGVSVVGPASQWIQQQLAHGINVDPNDPHVTQAIQEMSQNAYGPGYGDNPYADGSGAGDGGGGYTYNPGYGDGGPGFDTGMGGFPDGGFDQSVLDPGFFDFGGP